jgi:glycosyltransferase involved in cell wall biosynthesis
MAIFGSPETVTGGYLYNRTLVKYLRDMGHKVDIISQPYPKYYLNIFSLGKHLRQLPLDVLIQDEATHPAFFLVNQYLRTRVSYPIISIVHHLRSSERCSAWQKWLYGEIERRYLMNIDGFIFNSQTTLRSVEGMMGAKYPSIVAYPGGNRFSDCITEEEIAIRSKDPGPLRILFVGNVIRRKEVHTLLEAIGQLPHDVCNLTVVGDLFMDKSYVSTIYRQVKENGLTDRVLFLGSIPDNELITQFKASHVLVMPSSYEGFGIVYLEGMGFGLPAIASTGGGACEIISQGRDGLLIPVGDTVSLAGHLNDLHRDRDWLLSMSLNAHRRFESRPTWQVTTDNIQVFLKTIANNKIVQTYRQRRVELTAADKNK